MDFRVQDQLTVHAVRYYDKYENVFDKPNEQNDACIKSAMARKGGCEEAKIFSYCVENFFNRAEVVSFGAISFDFGAIRFRFGAIRFRFGAIRFCFDGLSINFLRLERLLFVLTASGL